MIIYYNCLEKNIYYEFIKIFWIFFLRYYILFFDFVFVIIIFLVVDNIKFIILIGIYLYKIIFNKFFIFNNYLYKILIFGFIFYSYRDISFGNVINFRLMNNKVYMCFEFFDKFWD